MVRLTVVLLLGLIAAPQVTTAARAPAHAATPTASAAQSVTFTPVADSYVDASAPSRNYGRAKVLRTDAAPVKTAYLRFNVQGVSTFGSSLLRVFVSSSNPIGFDVRGVSDNAWTELGLNFNNAPGFGPVVGSSGPVTAGSWHVIEVSQLVTANGLVSFALTTSSSAATTYSSREGAHPPELVISASAPPSEYVVSRNGDTYFADAPDGGFDYSGTLKQVVESAVRDLMAAGGGTVTFQAGTFDFGTDRFEFVNVTDVTFRGQGIDVTIIQNNTSAAADTEPFDCVGCKRLTIRDMTVSAAGAARSTSDALDFDAGEGILVERVKVAGSRARGIIFDGKDQGATSRDNIVRDCVITGVPSHGIQLLASSNNLVVGCNISNVGEHGIHISKSSTVASQPNKKSNFNRIMGNTVTGVGKNGINVNSSDYNEITGNVISGSGVDGITINSADSITCDGNVIHDNTSSSNKRYGLNIASPNCHDTIVGSGNIFQSNGTGAIRDAGTNTQYVPASARVSAAAVTGEPLARVTLGGQSIAYPPELWSGLAAGSARRPA